MLPIRDLLNPGEGGLHALQSAQAGAGPGRPHDALTAGWPSQRSSRGFQQDPTPAQEHDERVHERERERERQRASIILHPHQDPHEQEEVPVRPPAQPDEDSDPALLVRVEGRDDAVAVCKLCGRWLASLQASCACQRSSSFRCRWPGCGKSLLRTHQLKLHVRTHTGEKPHVCPHCGVGFAQKGDMERHVLIHTGEKPHVCDECGQRFRVGTTLSRHRRTHSGERPFVCPFASCGKSFAQKNDRDRHVRRHTGEKPFVCSYPGCPRRFASSGELTVHVRRMHGE